MVLRAELPPRNMSSPRRRAHAMPMHQALLQLRAHVLCIFLLHQQRTRVHLVDRVHQSPAAARSTLKHWILRGQRDHEYVTRRIFSFSKSNDLLSDEPHDQFDVAGLPRRSLQTRVCRRQEHPLRCNPDGIWERASLRAGKLKRTAKRLVNQASLLSGKKTASLSRTVAAVRPKSPLEGICNPPCRPRAS